MISRRLLPVAAAVALVPLLISGCIFDSDGAARDLEEAVLSSVEGVDDVLVSFSTSGFNRVPTAKLYIDNVADADVADLVRIADSSIEVIWDSMPYEPAEIGVAFADSPKPPNARMGDYGLVRIDAVWRELQLGGGGDDIYTVLRTALAERYGDWERP